VLLSYEVSSIPFVDGYHAPKSVLHPTSASPKCMDGADGFYELVVKL
jgi:hypothetical protein